MNHIDSSALKYPDNIHIWRQRHGWEKKFLEKAVRADLMDWGFNTVGWPQEVVVRYNTHSPAWPHEQYRQAGLPYCHLIRFTEMEMWNKYPRFPDVFGEEFEQWCDAQARSCCADMADDPYLIGYFYADVPAWNKSNFGDAWMDRFDMSSDSGRKDFARTAGRYYRVIHAAIRRYDPDHLLLGDRYDSNAGVPAELLEAMAPTVDVVSLQHFGTIDRFIENARGYHEITAKPVMNVDVGFHVRPFGGVSSPGIETQRDPGEAYARWAGACFDEPYFIGWHWCAYIENATRQAGLKDRFDEPHGAAVDLIRDLNRGLYERVGGRDA